jgi:pimeloyl-ACP methyl ester carboxylesterase
MKSGNTVSLLIPIILVLTAVAGCTNEISPATSTPTQVPYQQQVEDFIKNSSTFMFDGIAESVKFTSIVGSADGTSTAGDREFEVEYQTGHPGHGDRTGLVLAQVITKHTVVVKVENGVMTSALCDSDWDMINDKGLPMSVTGTVIGGGDMTSPDGPVDVPRVFVYEVNRDDGTTVKVSYTAYPPSPVGDANRNKITLDFAGGAINIGDRMEALGRIDKETNTIVVSDEGDYIKTHPVELPVISEDISWQIDDTVVTATITRPDDSSIHAAVVFVAGSGPTDRDWNSPLISGTNGSAKLLAEELAKSGFVTIRYDKRVTGPNAQANLPLLIGKISMESHVDELAGAVEQLLALPNVNPEKIFVLANSEGTIHALHYQLSRKPAFAGLILTGMPGRNMADLMRAQLAAQYEPLPDGPEIMAGYDKLMDDFLAGKPFEADPALPEFINTLFQGFNATVNLPFTRQLFMLDPAPLLGQVTVPTIVVIGEKDIQADYQLDVAPLEDAATGHVNISFVHPENADHVLKFEPRPRENLTAADSLNYNASDRVLDPDALQIIKNWLAVNN